MNPRDASLHLLPVCKLGKGPHLRGPSELSEVAVPCPPPQEGLDPQLPAQPSWLSQAWGLPRLFPARTRLQAPCWAHLGLWPGSCPFRTHHSQPPVPGWTRTPGQHSPKPCLPCKALAPSITGTATLHRTSWQHTATPQVFPRPQSTIQAVSGHVGGPRPALSSYRGQSCHQGHSGRWEEPPHGL